MADNLKERIQEMKAAAEKATPGPWIAHPSFPEWIVPESDVLKYIGGSVDEVEDREKFATPVAHAEANVLSAFAHDRLRLSERLSNARFIAAVNPAAILALIAENERLQRLEALVTEKAAAHEAAAKDGLPNDQTAARSATAARILQDILNAVGPTR